MYVCMYIYIYIYIYIYNIHARNFRNYFESGFCLVGRLVGWALLHPREAHPVAADRATSAGRCTQKWTSRGLSRQGIVSKHRNS